MLHKQYSRRIADTPIETAADIDQQKHKTPYAEVVNIQLHCQKYRSKKL